MNIAPRYLGRGSWLARRDPRVLVLVIALFIFTVLQVWDGRVVFALLLVAGLEVFAQTAVGTISQVAGTPQVARGGHAATVTQGMAVLLLDKFTTDSSSSLTALTSTCRQ